LTKKPPKKTSARAERRALDRDARKLAERREKLAELSPGGAPERPIEVASASLVDPMARAARCARCEGAVKLEEHAAERGLRVARVTCTTCGARRSLWFRIAAPVLH
jgi:hypothetical protein